MPDGRTLAGMAAIWAGDADPAAMAGATLLWADHYLVTDRAAELMVSSPRPVALAVELRGAVRDLPPAGQRKAAAELGRKLQAGAEALRKDMARARRWKLVAPGVTAAAAGAAATAAMAIGAAGPMAGTVDLLTGLASAFASGAVVFLYLSDRASQHTNPAFALVLADGLATPRVSNRPVRQEPVATITAVMAHGAHSYPRGRRMRLHAPESSLDTIWQPHYG